MDPAAPFKADRRGPRHGVDDPAVAGW